MNTLFIIIIIIGLLVSIQIIHKAANKMKNLSQGRDGPYAKVPTSELVLRHAELNKHFDILTYEEIKEHDKILHVLLMRGKKPY